MNTIKSNNVFNCLVLLCILLLAVVSSSHGQQSRGRFQPSRNKAPSKQTTGCEEGDCYPETGDLLIGRSSPRFLEASSTCGLTHPERYCILGSIRETTKCDACDSQEPYDPFENTNSHLVENIVSRKQSDRFNRWWQSENGKENVSIRFDLETDFAFTHIIMTFKTFRPAAMLIEKSSDFGKTWKTYGYFAANCLDSFPGISTYLPKNLGDVYCENKYSLDTPSTKGEVVFKILPPTLIQSRDPYSPEIQDLLKITNLRINFTKLHTFGDNLLDSRNEIKEKYYYAMYEMVVRGSCLCYGHANACEKVHGVEYDKEYNASNGQLPGMVHGKCVCKHHTTGNNCEKCLPLYNDRPWEPARAGRTNECKKCNCNEHADSCHFDDEVYRQSGMTSGGVCDNCRHNTFGINCEHCLENHWRDPTREITDYDSCKPCTCHPDGSMREGRCDPYTDAEQGLVAGKCHCKYYVDGENCDRCKNGYFNLTAENPAGCEPCSCNLIGTRDNLGCDKDTGLCNCKRYVAGRACDQCLENFFGLSEDDPDGCKPCDCSPGGSIDNECDRQTGQCKCKPNMGGRACDQPLNGFYCPTLDHLLYEAEYARKLDDRSTDYNKTLHYDEKPRWTGNGYVRVFEGSSLEFRVEPLHRSGNYEIVIRYENHQGEAWQDVRITIDRQGQQPDVNDVCAESTSEDDAKAAHLPSGVDFSIINPPVCLERARYYTIKVEFVRFNDNIRNASLIIDSILLVPINNELPTLHSLEDSSSLDHSQRLREDLLNEFTVYRCKEAQLSVVKDIPEYCEKFICNIGVFHDHAPACDCDPTGSKSAICEKYGGDCKCKSNVVGRRCENCAPASFGFGPNGCQPCNCDPYGSKNSFCDLETGQCDCYERIEGKHCDTCFDNYWRFPSCDPCYCNGFADRCNQTDGKCIDCRDHTSGDYCENCHDGYYGKPASGVPCRECMCPGGSSGNQFADTCHLDERYNTFICECHEGYYGPQCDKCAPHFYGNPLEKGGSCTKCECNGNVDLNDPESCDQQTGVCKNCLYNTDGEHCEHCKPGFYGNASNHDCRPCQCYEPGTEGSELNCDEETGQCKCLPNVIGQRCDQCKPDHYGLSSGEGCKDCDCDTRGTINGATYCDLETGQCYCNDSRGGRDCSECSDFYWGDPYQECKRCECNVRGSKSAQCDKHTGCCECIKGITGCHCDRCARGTTGEVPRCEPCGECFDDWTDVINNVRDDLDNLEQRASNLVVAAGSNTKNFSAEYTLLEQKLNDIKSAIASNRTDRDLKDLNDRVQSIKKQLENKKKTREKYEEVEKWTKENNDLDDARSQYQKLKEQTETLTREAMILKESHESGAIESINKAYKQSEDAANNLAAYESKLNAELSPVLKRLQDKIDVSKDNFEESDKMIKGYLDEVLKSLSNSMQNIHGLNEAVCGQLTSDSQKCSAQCGGAVCDGKCGTNTSSCSGMVDSYWKLMNAKSEFDELYNQQELKFKKILTRLRNTSNSLNSANKEIGDLLNYANTSLKDIQDKHHDLTDLINNLNNFTKANQEKPDKIMENAVHVKNLDLSLTDESLDKILDEISLLAEKVNVGDIERDTEKNKAESRELKERVDQLDAILPDLQNQMNKTLSDYNSAKASLDANQKKLDDIEKKNENVDAELSHSNNSISSIEKMIESITASLTNLRNKANVDPDKDKSHFYQQKVDGLKSKVKESQYTLEMTRDNLDTLDQRLKEVSDRIQNVLQSSNNKNGAEILTKLIELQSNIINKRNAIEEKAIKLKKLDSQNDEIRKKIGELKNLLSGLKGRAVDIKSDIQSKEKYFNSCS